MKYLKIRKIKAEILEIFRDSSSQTIICVLII